MLNQRSFSEIFSDVHHENQSENLSSEWESLLEPAWMAQVIAQVGPLNIRPTPLYRYKKPVAKPAPAVERKSHDLNENQMAAYQELNQHQTKALHGGFSAHELKSAYRQALLKTHPDQGGTAESFQQVKKSYEILLVFVTK